MEELLSGVVHCESGEEKMTWLNGYQKMRTQTSLPTPFLCLIPELTYLGENKGEQLSLSPKYQPPNPTGTWLPAGRGTRAGMVPLARPIIIGCDRGEETDRFGLPPGWVAPKDWSICSMVGAMA